jgi:hypothetical protein
MILDQLLINNFLNIRFCERCAIMKTIDKMARSTKPVNFFFAESV